MRVGDRQAFAALFANWAAVLCSFAHSYVDAATAEDIVQDLFSWIWEHRHTLEQPRSLRAYLYAAVRNRALNAVRDRRIADAFHERLTHQTRIKNGERTVDGVESNVRAGDLAAAVARLVHAMPPRSREVFTLLRDHHMTTTDVAELLQLSPKTVENHLTRALSFLRANLGPWIEP